MQGQVQNKKAKIDGDMEWEEDKYTKNFFLPVVFHNLKSYDAHFVIKHFKKQYTARCRDQDDDDQEEESVSYADIRVTPLKRRKVFILPGRKCTFYRLFPVSLNVLGQPRVAAFEKSS